MASVDDLVKEIKDLQRVELQGVASAIDKTLETYTESSKTALQIGVLLIKLFIAEKARRKRELYEVSNFEEDYHTEFPIVNFKGVNHDTQELSYSVSFQWSAG